MSDTKAKPSDVPDKQANSSDPESVAAQGARRGKKDEHGRVYNTALNRPDFSDPAEREKYTQAQLDKTREAEEETRNEEKTTVEELKQSPKAVSRRVTKEQLENAKDKS